MQDVKSPRPRKFNPVKVVYHDDCESCEKTRKVIEVTIVDTIGVKNE